MEAEQIEALGQWLGQHLGAEAELTDVAALSTGFSAQTIGVRFGDRRLVLRVESPDPAVYPAQAPGHDVEVDIQYQVMRALGAGTSIPLAALVGYEPSPDVLGAPFFIMDFVDGEVPLVTPSYAATGFVFEASPDLRRQIVVDGLRQLAQLHTLDWEHHQLGWLLPPGQEPTAIRQVEIWEAYTDRELAGRRHDLIETGFAWLKEHQPPHDPGQVTLNWGDPRLGNMIWNEHRCVCVTDFEAACIAPYLVDLGWWLMFDRWSHEQSGAVRLEGEPTREEQASLYFELAGREPRPTHWYEVFAALRYSAIVVRIINRMVDRGLMPAGSDYWKDNQATACLEELLG
jgi:aminoglycoside phosphotransferase (APT) family kinase protein